MELTGGEGVDVIIETSGNARAIRDAVHTVKRGGRIVQVGLSAEGEVPIDMNRLADFELNVYGVFRYANTYPAAIQALSRSDIDLEKVITHRYALKDIREAVEMARTQKDRSIKIMIYPHEMS